jgi:hypothetical protein
VYRVRREGLPGAHVLNDTTEYRCYRARESGKVPVRGFIATGREDARRTSNYVQLRQTGCTTPWDEALSKPNAWLPSEIAKGIPKSYLGGNYKDSQLLVAASQCELAKLSWREQLSRSRGLILDKAALLDGSSAGLAPSNAVINSKKTKVKAREPDDF